VDTPFVFDKFYQSQNQTLKKPKGSGFGLAICKQIIELHQGVIYVDNLFIEGTKIGIEFPLKRNSNE